MRLARAFCGCAMLLVSSAALASETIAYNYDALGRVTNVARAGTVNSGVNQAYSYDAVDNRSSVTVTGSPFTGSTRVVVLPLRGLFVLPLGGP